MREECEVAVTVLRERMGSVYAYMLACLEMIRSKRPALYQRIIAAVPNPSALVRENAASIKERLELAFNPFTGDYTVSVIGAQFYKKRATSIVENVAESDFVIAPTRKQPDDEKLPLVLRGNFNGQIEQYRYVDKVWDSATEVFAGNVPVAERKLPDTAIQYPFLTTADFLAESMIQLSAEIDSQHFFDGNLVSRNENCKRGYLLPLTATFFQYFDAADASRRIFGRNMLDIEEKRIICL